MYKRYADTKENPIANRFLDPAHITLIVFASLYTAIWSVISYRRFLNLDTHVFDLGIVAERSWLIFHTQWTPLALLSQTFHSGIVFVLSPFFIIGGFKFILVFQSFFVGFSIIPLYYIAKHFLKNKLPSLLIASSLLIYFPLAGLNWFGFHYQAIFLPLFLIGYAFYLRGNIKTSIVFFFLSGITRYPYVIFPLVFSFYTSFELFLGSFRTRTKITRKNWYFIGFSIFLLAQLIITFTFSHGNAGLASGLHSSTSLSVSHEILSQLDVKIQTIALIFLPVLCLTFLSKKWSLFLIPWIALMFVSSNQIYLYPRLFQLQYTAGIVPFVYLGLIEGLASITVEKEGKPEIKRFPYSQSWKNQTKIAVTILVILTLLGTAYLPYGPYNKDTQMNYDFNQAFSANTTTYNDVMALVSLVPNNASNVLIQNGLPQLLPRPEYHGSLLIPATSIGYNLSFRNGTGQWEKINPQYIVAYTSGFYFTYRPAYPYNISMAEIVAELTAKSSYGIVGEASNMFLIEKNYTGPVKYYVPYEYSYPKFQFYYPPTVQGNGSKIIARDPSNNSFAWYGPYTTLVPGTYKITYYLQTSNTSSSNRLSLDVAARGGTLNLGEETINGTVLSNSQITGITQTVTIKNFYSDIEFRGIVSHWNGTLTFTGVQVKQLSYFTKSV